MPTFVDNLNQSIVSLLLAMLNKNYSYPFNFDSFTRKIKLK
jgi:hypothetical protein